LSRVHRDTPTDKETTSTDVLLIYASWMRVEFAVTMRPSHKAVFTTEQRTQSNHDAREFDTLYTLRVVVEQLQTKIGLQVTVIGRHH